LREGVDARLASQIITYYYGIDGLARTREVFGWSLERSNQWLLAHASADRHELICEITAGPLPRLGSYPNFRGGTQACPLSAGHRLCRPGPAGSVLGRRAGL
jgi:hypothetical protein